MLPAASTAKTETNAADGHCVRMGAIFATVLAVALALAACMRLSERQATSVPDTEFIRPGVTTRAEVVEMLGPPDSVVRNGEVRYVFLRRKQSTGVIAAPMPPNLVKQLTKTETDELTVIFNANTWVVTGTELRRGR